LLSTTFFLLALGSFWARTNANATALAFFS
jgi:hypothetical protein